MLLSIIVLAFSSSIDSFGIGITYGLRKTNLTRFAKFILFMISIIITSISIFVGNKLTLIFTSNFTKLLGSLILIIMGIVIIFQIINSKEKNNSSINNETNKNANQCLENQFFIKFLGITVQIIKDPISSDIDNSNNIDTKEAIYLGIALSIDSFCIGIGSSILGFSSLLFPILVASFQFIFLTIGKILGEKVNKISKVPSNIWNLISGVLLILIGLSRIWI